MYTVSLICAFFAAVSAIPAHPFFVKNPFTIEEAALGEIKQKSYEGRWISDNEIHYYNSESKEVRLYNVETDITEVLLQNTRFDDIDYAISPSKEYILIAYDKIKNFRHSKKAKYVVYSIKEKKYHKVSGGEYLQMAEWGPDRNYIIYIKGNDIYAINGIHVDDLYGEMLTNSGREGVVFNGIADWGYEEEILRTNKAFWWSEDGKDIAYLRFIDISVPPVFISEYGKPVNPETSEGQYERIQRIFYPKSGAVIPTFELWHTFIDSYPQQSTKILTQDEDHKIFHNLQWYKRFIVYAVTNRDQNQMKINKCRDLDPSDCTTLFHEENPNGWANVKLPLLSEADDRMIRIESREVPLQAGNYSHLMIYNKNGQTYQLTSGKFEVISIAHWDQTARMIYYIASEEDRPTASQLYSVSEEKGSQPSCLTCEIISPEGNNCKDVSASFTKNGKYVILSCNGPDPIVTYLFKNENGFNRMKVLHGNWDFRSKLAQKLMPQIVDMEIPVTETLNATVRLYLPPFMDKTGQTKYPLFIQVYGSPGSKNIYDKFKINWGHYLSTEQKVIYGFIDGRGTLRKGENMLLPIYKNLGTVEIEDQISVTRYLQENLKYIDSAKTGIWGWSYGGYSTIKVLEMDKKDIFKCGIAVAPVTDWMYYDAFYTERYMLQPFENKAGYVKSSALGDVSNLKYKKFLLIHGNKDDNVHYQNSMILAKLLQEKDIEFEQMSYPDEDHSIRNVRPHLYHTMNRFILKCFEQSP